MANDANYMLQHPRKQTFYKVIGTLMSALALGDQTWWGYNTPHFCLKLLSWIVMPTVLMCLTSELLYMIIYRARLTFETLGVIFAVLPVTVLILVNSVSAKFKIYHVIMKDFMEKIHVHNFKERDININEIRIKIERYSRYTSYFLIVCIMVDWVCWTVVPVAYNVYNIDLIRNETKSLQVFIYFVMPFDYEYNVRNWVYLHIADSFVAWIGCAIVSVYNSINYMFVFHFTGHIKILKEKIKFNLHNISESNDVSEKLIDVIKYHTFITNMFTNIKAAFGFNVTANYMHNLIGDSILLFEVMFGEKGYLLTHGLMFLLYMGGLILMSFVLEEIKIQSDDLAEIVYNVPWEDMSVRDQKTYILFLSRVQQPFEFVGAGGLKAGVTPMVSIIKSTFSYYVMLKTSMKE